jgi:hypothetical protein
MRNIENKKENKQVKVTKSDIKRILIEEIERDEELLNAIRSLTKKIEGLDVSVDYLAASITGEDPMSLGAIQKSLGRGARPPIRRVEPSYKQELEEAIREELETILSEEELEEKLSSSAPVGDWIDDFQKSDAPQFKGKSKKKRTQMAAAAAMDAKKRGA